MKISIKCKKLKNIMSILFNNPLKYFKQPSRVTGNNESKYKKPHICNCAIADIININSTTGAG